MQTEIRNLDYAPDKAQVGMSMQSGNAAKSPLRKLFLTITGFILAVTMLIGLGSLVFAQDGPADIELPSDVENVEAVPGDSMVNLSWDVATDNVGVEGYKVYYGQESVTGQGGKYQYALEVGDVIEYDVKNLVNGGTYYFAVTAYDAAGNEVEATPQVAPSEEVSEPLPLGDDGRAPTVKSAEGYSNVQIKVVFSEPVVLPAEGSQTTFFVEDNLTGEFLPLLDAEVMQNDKKVVVIETAPQDSDSEYILTAGFTIQDVYGNQVRSGTSDTATFIGGEGEYIALNAGMLAENADAPVADVPTETSGSVLDGAVDDLSGELVSDAVSDSENIFGEAVENSDSAGVVLDEEESQNLYNAADGDLPEGLVSVEAISGTEVQVVFSEPVQFVEAQTHFAVVEKDAPVDPASEAMALMVISVEELMEDRVTAVFTVESMKPGFDYVLSIMNVVTSAGVAINSGDGIEFQAKTLKLVDVIPPAEVTNFVARLEGSLVKLTWSVSVSEDSIEQIIHESTDGTNYSEKVVLPPLVSGFDISDLMAGATYWFKITSRDAAGNESEGVVVKVTLPETGPGLALVFGISALATAVARRKKRSF